MRVNTFSQVNRVLRVNIPVLQQSHHRCRLDHRTRFRGIPDSVIQHLPVPCRRLRHVRDGLYISRLHVHQDSRPSAGLVMLQLPGQSPLHNILTLHVNRRHHVIPVHRIIHRHRNPPSRHHLPDTPSRFPPQLFLESPFNPHASLETTILRLVQITDRPVGQVPVRLQTHVLPFQNQTALRTPFPKNRKFLNLQQVGVRNFLLVHKQITIRLCPVLPLPQLLPVLHRRGILEKAGQHHRQTIHLLPEQRVRNRLTIQPQRIIRNRTRQNSPVIRVYIPPVRCHFKILKRHRTSHLPPLIPLPYLHVQGFYHDKGSNHHHDQVHKSQPPGQFMFYRCCHVIVKN